MNYPLGTGQPWPDRVFGTSGTTAMMRICQNGQHYGYKIRVNGGPLHCSNCGAPMAMSDPPPLDNYIGALEARIARLATEVAALKELHT